MTQWEEIWQFKTKRFSVHLECAPEDSPDVSWMDEDDLAKLDSGEWVNVTFRVRVMCDGLEFGTDYLGNSVYANVRDFYTEHLGVRAKARVEGVSYGCYFTDMVANAISDTRNALRDAPRMRVA